ncbi:MULTISPECIES: uracil-DNA glycosylase [Rhodobacterales]|uniref:Uracil-DNA glycosylase n=3 Tax=Roseobacteraceae TaxID=2854170 RepID=A0A1M4N0A4_9RHOB|nr:MULTISPECIES: uracil-DNA glycosylase [Rhodobacterales]MCE8548104.1 uracil-DNA glycosylase [Ruegeria pomeroyi]MBV7380992.1 uracil-DNA glycosylase [Maritimibacter dapengensis]OOY07529.1 uracil-DNA glycosylase [Thioclava sp. F36-7]PRY84452.1 uracil DNA glycosylase superfamily protein [Donghicola tyrosinivorans]SCM66486.1 uracil-DNA glycosylase [Donghicola eburneus]
MNTPESFVEELAAVDLVNTFNPYSDICPIHDTVDAARARRENLKRCLEAAMNARADTIWIARDLGYRGGRRTGVPLTDEAHLTEAEHLFGGITLARATTGPALAERTATVTWQLLSSIGRPVMLWNVFPLHPHAPDDPMTNRSHRKTERSATWPFLLALLEMLQPKRLVAIGRDAGEALADLDLPVSQVRHPSYGGQSEFIAGIEAIYNLSSSARRPETATLPFAEFA